MDTPHIVSAVVKLSSLLSEPFTVKTAEHHSEMASADSEKQPTALILIADGSEEIEFVTPYE